MESFATLGDQLIKVEVDECNSATFQCIICSEAFLSRPERNEHLERHFVHRKCNHCDREVIAIGDLDFELHRPVHCHTKIDLCELNTSPSVCIMRKSLQPVPAHRHESISEMDGEAIEFIEDDEDEEENVEHKFCEIHVVSAVKSEEIDESTSPTRKSRRRRAKVNYDDSDDAPLIIKKSPHSDDMKPKIQKKIVRKRGRPSREPKSKVTKDSDVGEMPNFGDDERNVNDEDEDDGDGVVFDMKFDELSGDDSEADENLQSQMDANLDKKRLRRKWAKPKNIPCPDCKMMFRSDRTLKTHRKRDHGYVQRNICTVCGREFKDAGNLNQHMHTHGDSKRYICNFCGKGFHMPYNLKEHMHQHTGERPYECSVCGKTFNRQTLRAAHMRVHTGEKPFKCSYENCERAYAYSTDLKRHKRSAHGEIGKTFPCPICGKVFYENKFLTKHLNVHQGKM